MEAVRGLALMEVCYCCEEDANSWHCLVPVFVPTIRCFHRKLLVTEARSHLDIPVHVIAHLKASWQGLCRLKFVASSP